LLRKTISNWLKAKLVNFSTELRKRINWSIKEVGDWLKRSVKGYFNYFAVPDNLDTLGAFRSSLAKLWLKVIRRRGNKARMTWKKFAPIIDKWIPKPIRVNPYPSQRLALTSNWGAQCVSSARWDLCGGIPVRVFPTETLYYIPMKLLT
jgi:hypothetical protein